MGGVERSPGYQCLCDLLGGEGEDKNHDDVIRLERKTEGERERERDKRDKEGGGREGGARQTEGQAR